MTRNTRILTRGLTAALAATSCIALAAPAFGQSNIDPAHKVAWQENCGWLNWYDADGGVQGVRVDASILSGFIWAENIGWIDVGDGTPDGDCDGVVCYANDDGTDCGVNVDPDGTLRGLAWGENVGWINFDTLAALGPYQQEAQLNVCDNTLAGYAWGENVGWINLDDATHFVALGPACAAGDVACDGTIGLFDYAAFKGVLLGPNAPVDCPLFDFDTDGDVDRLDFAEFLASFTGG